MPILIAQSLPTCADGSLMYTNNFDSQTGGPHTVVVGGRYDMSAPGAKIKWDVPNADDCMT